MINSIFSKNTATPTATWKSVAADTGGRTSLLFPAKPTTGDNVSLGKLGKELSGVAAEAFNHLDDKSKGVLEGLVNSGKISAEQAIQGLRAFATDATFSRYQKERPQSDQDKAFLKESEEAWKRQQLAGRRFGDAMHDYRSAYGDLVASHERGEMTLEELWDKNSELSKQFNQDSAPFREEMAQSVGPSLEENFNRIRDNFNRTVSGLISGGGLIAKDDPAGIEAKQKLQTLGFDGHLFGDAFSDFADTVDLPGIGRHDTPSIQATITTIEATPSVNAATPSQVAASVGGVKASTKTTFGSGDPGKAKTAISLLQSALDAKTKAKASPVTAVTAASAEADAGLSSLIDALKSGAKPASPNVKIDT